MAIECSNGEGCQVHMISLCKKHSEELNYFRNGYNEGMLERCISPVTIQCIRVLIFMFCNILFPHIFIKKFLKRI